MDHICKILAYTKKGSDSPFGLYLLIHNFIKEPILSGIGSNPLAVFWGVNYVPLQLVFLHKAVNPGSNFCLGNTLHFFFFSPSNQKIQTAI